MKNFAWLVKQLRFGTIQRLELRPKKGKKIMNEDQYLIHYGIKGMRWGHRKLLNVGMAKKKTKVIGTPSRADQRIYGKGAAQRMANRKAAGKSRRVGLEVGLSATKTILAMAVAGKAISTIREGRLNSLGKSAVDKMFNIIRR